MTTPTPDELEDARALVHDYFLSWGMERVEDPDLLEELDDLPRRYGPPDGATVIAYVGGSPAGVVALRRHDERSCVMKRLFVRPAFRGAGVGRVLAERLLLQAERLGFARMVLDTPADNAPAIALYRSLGFTPTEPYFDPGHEHVHEGWSFWEVVLTSRGGAHSGSESLASEMQGR